MYIYAYKYNLLLWCWWILGDPRSQRRASIRGFGASALQGMLVENPLNEVQEN